MYPIRLKPCPGKFIYVLCCFNTLNAQDTIKKPTVMVGEILMKNYLV
jgi:hypothetical protein